MYKEFYEQTIGFDEYIEIRCFRADGMIFSKYFKTWPELGLFIKNNKDKYNLYCGVNPRKEEGRKLSSIKYLKNIVIDIEMSGKKDKLYNDENEYTEYAKEIMRTVNFIQEYLFNKYKLKINTVSISGRGMHIYITLSEQISVVDYKFKYKKWYKEICEHINKNNPYSGKIKVDVCCSDFTRILGAPGSINIKYLEKPVREIIYQNLETDNKIKDILDKYTTPINKNTVKEHSKNKKYNNTTIFNSPEFKIFEYSPIPGTNINNKLRLALRLLMARDGCDNYEEVAKRIAELGYPYKEMNFIEKDYPDYKYNELLLNSYVLDNFEWAVDVGFKLPYELKEEKYLKKYEKYIMRIDSFCPDTIEEIKNINDFIYEIKKFNNNYKTKIDGKVGLGLDSLEKFIFLHINNGKLREFIIKNRLFDRLKTYL